MTFKESVTICFRKYADFKGRASRPEYWWFVLFLILGTVATTLIHDTLRALFFWATFIPSIAAAARRLHDTNRSGWWQLIAFVPLIGVIVLIVLLAQESKSEVSPA